MHEYSCSNLRAGPGRSRKLNLNMNMIFTLCNWGWLRLAPRLVIASNWIRLDQTGSKSRLNQVHKDQRVKILVLGGSLEYHYWNKIPLFLRFCSMCNSVEPFFCQTRISSQWNGLKYSGGDWTKFKRHLITIFSCNYFLIFKLITSPCHHHSVAQNHPLARHPSVVNWQFFEYSLFEFIAPE